MCTHQRRSPCRLFVSPVHQSDLPQPMLAVLRGDSSIDLAELAQAIAADRNLSLRVVQAATQECGWPAVTVEQAIVLLGRERLAAQVLHEVEPKR